MFLAIPLNDYFLILSLDFLVGNEDLIVKQGREAILKGSHVQLVLLIPFLLVFNWFFNDLSILFAMGYCRAKSHYIFLMHMAAHKE